MGLKIKSYGWRSEKLDQISRIESGFLELGHQIIEDGNCDFIYAHCSSNWVRAIDYKNKYPDSKLLLKCLDLPIHTKSNFYSEKELLSKADVILSNSKTVQNQIKDILGLESIVVYDVPHETYQISSIKKTFDWYMNGRLLDNNKRFSFVKELLQLEENKDKIFVCSGPETPYFPFDNKNTFTFGVMDFNGLNTLYNNARISFCFGKIEGIGLQMLESCQAGCVPISLSDNPTSFEFLPKEFICYPNIESINNKIKEIERNYEYFKKLALIKGEEFKQRFNKKQISKNIIDAYISIK